MKRILNLKIKQYIILLTLLPALIITTALTSYLIVSRQSDAQENLLDNIVNTINYLANASQLPLFSGDKGSLNRLVSAAIRNENMTSVTFYDSQKIVFYSQGEKYRNYKIYNDNSLHLEKLDSHWIVQSPVYTSEVEVNDFPDEDPKEAIRNPLKILGWVEITADNTFLKDKQQSILFAGAAIGILIFTFLAFLATRFARSMTLPLEKITSTVKELKTGNLSARISILAKGEMNDLVNGINSLAEEVEESNERLQFNIDKATSKLSLALGDLEYANQKLKNNVIQEKEQRQEQEQMLLRQCRMANMGEMLDSIAHQWRQPLMHINSILMNMGTTLDNKKISGNYLEEKIDEVAALTTHMSQTIEDFRGLFKQENEQSQFYLTSAINDVLMLMKNSLNDIDIVYDSNAVVSVIGYRSELIQVIIILLSNAVEALNNRDIKNKKIKIKTSTQLFNSSVDIIIEDNAGGISPENLATVFDPYFTTKQQLGGTGLGLYIAKIIIEHKMAGKLTVTNTTDGAKFSILLGKPKI
jgi:signal transduction histidine kinase